MSCCQASRRARCLAQTHLLGNLLKVKSTSRTDNDLLVDLHTGEGGDLGTGGDDDVLGLDDLLGTLVHGDLDFGRRVERGETLLVRDGVLGEEVLLDTAGEAVDGGVLVGEHLLEVDLNVVELNSLLGERVLGLVELMTRIEAGERGISISSEDCTQTALNKGQANLQSLGGDAADIEAGSSRRSSSVNAHGLEAELRSLDGSDVSSRS